jgi:hypothetical protein
VNRLQFTINFTNTAEVMSYVQGNVKNLVPYQIFLEFSGTSALNIRQLDPSEGLHGAHGIPTGAIFLPKLKLFLPMLECLENVLQ